MSLFAEIVHEAATDPLRAAVEIAQFAILLAIVWVLVIGGGKRKGIVVGMLEDRRERLRTALEEADRAEAGLLEARERSGTMAADARSEAARVLSDARKTARKGAEAILVAAEQESERLKRHAEEVLDRELAEMRVDLRDRLVELVAGATRMVLNEGMSPAEQRSAIQEAILAGVERMQPAAPAADEPPAGRRE